MTKRLGTLRQYVDIFGKGLVREMAPEIAAGVLLELLQLWRIDIQVITEHVNNNRSLWENLDEKRRNTLKKVARRVGNLDWISIDWVIVAIKKDFPSVASLILGWPEAHAWMERQVEELKNLLIEDVAG